jgi:DNA-binding winged helix-turn-helix (wHTH) protein/tetratricopeptide (TPR) repeat protein
MSDSIRPIAEEWPAAINLASEQRFPLGDLKVSPATRELLTGDSVVMLEPRVMQVLVALARRRGDVVSRDELTAACWGGRIVGDDAISRCIQALRRLASEHGGFSILTVARVGYRLVEADPDPVGGIPSQRSTESAAATLNERRRLTVLACRLVRDWSDVAQLDPEEWLPIAQAYRRTVSDVAASLGGFVGKGSSDNLTVYFGYPDAKEDAAESAVRAGLAIVEASRVLSADAASRLQVRLAVRIGIHAGDVVISRRGAEPEVFGEAPDVAALVQAVAEPDTVAFTAAVRSLVAGLFVVEEGRQQPSEGAAAIQVYKVVAPAVATPTARRFASRELTPFVGREEELQLLLGRWKRVRRGEGQHVLLMGEPGMGKSRLVQEFQGRIRGDPHMWVECFGERVSSNSPLHAVTTMLDQVLGWRGDESPQERLGALELALQRSQFPDAVPLVAELLNLELPPTYRPPDLPPNLKRQQLLACLVAWVLSAAHDQPLVLVVEDLQWLDASTMELLEALVERGAGVPLMLLCTARLGFQPGWPARSHHAQIMLGRLSPDEARELVTGVVAQAGLSDDVIAVVASRTDGVPLFAEELTRLMLDSDGRAGGRDIPATLHDSLAARLDSLGGARDVARLAAVLGREFSSELIAAVSQMPPDELQDGLAKLADSELIFVRGSPPHARYQFKHALILDVAYEGMLRGQRRELHARVAQTLIDRFPNLVETQPEMLALHWSNAGEADRAVAAWATAAMAAGGRFAYEESIQSYRNALSELATLPETPERDMRELQLNISLGEHVGVTRGFHSADYVALNERGVELAERRGDLLQLVMQGMARFVTAFTAGELPRARALADRLLDLSTREGGDFSLKVGYMAQLLGRVSAGDLAGAEANFHRWNAIVERSGYSPFTGETLTVLGGMAETAFALGRPDWAGDLADRLLAYAREINGPFEIVAALSVEAWIRVLRREPKAAEAAAAEALALAEAHAFKQAGQARALVAWARAHLGAGDESLALAERSVVGWVGGGVPRLAEARRMLAQVRSVCGATAEALAEFDSLCEAANDNPVMLSGHLIGRAEARITAGRPREAEADLRAAIELAQQRGAKGWELRAATHLAGLLRGRGDLDAARDALAPVVQWFAEGRSTPDLKDARAMLDTLG